MGIVEFVAVVVVVIALFAWLMGRPHTLASTARTRAAGRDAGDSTGYATTDSYVTADSYSSSYSFDGNGDAGVADSAASDACSDGSDSGAADSSSCDGGGDGGSSD